MPRSLQFTQHKPATDVTTIRYRLAQTLHIDQSPNCKLKTDSPQRSTTTINHSSTFLSFKSPLKPNIISLHKIITCHHHFILNKPFFSFFPSPLSFSLSFFPLSFPPSDKLPIPLLRPPADEKEFVCCKLPRDGAIELFPFPFPFPFAFPGAIACGGGASGGGPMGGVQYRRSIILLVSVLKGTMTMVPRGNGGLGNVVLRLLRPAAYPLCNRGCQRHTISQHRSGPYSG
jgi:hypothetical protein